MALCTEEYWENIKKTVKGVLPDHVVDCCVIPKFYVNLEEFRQKVLQQLLVYTKKPITPNKYVHPLVLLGNNKKLWPQKITELIYSLDYLELCSVNDNKHNIIHNFHYQCWKKRNFVSNFEFPREPSNKRTLWGFERIEFPDRYDCVSIVYEAENGQKSVVKGYFSFDDSIYEDRRRFIGISEERKQVETFDLDICGDKLTFYRKIETNDILRQLKDGISYYFSFRDDIPPWDIKNNSINTIVYDGIERRERVSFMFIRKINEDFARWEVLDETGVLKEIDISFFTRPKIYVSFDSNYYASKDFVSISCVTFPTYANMKPFERDVKFEIQFEPKEIISFVIPKLINGVMLGGLGKDLIIHKEKVSIYSMPFHRDIDIHQIMDNFKKNLENFTIFSDIELSEPRHGDFVKVLLK